MAAKIDWHRYETKLRHCYSIYSSNKDTVVIYTRLPRQKLYRRNAECARLDCHFVSPGSKLQLGPTLIHQSVFYVGRFAEWTAEQSRGAFIERLFAGDWSGRSHCCPFVDCGQVFVPALLMLQTDRGIELLHWIYL